jgi:peptidoglycan/LPS O-acetylase OafA/YrhL
LLIGYFPIPLLSNFRKIGDMSYGIYIYSFPIEQTFMYYFKFNIYELMISSLVVSIIFGYLSWHFIEKKALKYKKDLYFNSLIKQTRQIFIRS